MLNPIRNRRRRLRGQSRRGATAVEFAMVAPAFMIVITVCAEFARMSILRNLAQNACYESCRYIMTEGALVEDGVARAQQILNRVGNVQCTILVNGADGSRDADGNVINEIRFNTPYVTTQIDIPLAGNTVILPSRFFGSARIQAQMSMRTERYRGYFDSTDPTTE